MVRKFFEAHSNAGGGAGDHEEKEPVKNKMQEWKEEIHGGKDEKEKPAPIAKETAHEFIKGRTEQVKEEMSQSPGEGLTGAIVDANYGSEIHERIKEIRERIDSLYLTAKFLSNKPYFQSREMSLAVTAFQSSRQFTGKILQERGAVYPYKDENTERPNQGKVIESLSVTGNPTLDTTLQMLKQFREEAQNVITDFGIFGQHTSVVSWIEFICHGDVMSGLLSGKMWLGELYAILNEQKG